MRQRLANRETVTMFELYSESQQRVVLNIEGTPFATFAEAKNYQDCYAFMYDGFKPRKIKVIKTWQDRERRRLEDGTYAPLPFASYSGWLALVKANPEHFAHCSRKQVARIAYTESEKKGTGDVQTPISVAAYLEKFGAELSADDKSEILSCWGQDPQSAEVHFARTVEDILDVMYRLDTPTSCMIGHNFERATHPYRVYGEGSDITLAYLETGEGTCVSRCLVWESKKLWGRIFGDSEKICRALRELGFSEGKFEGAKLKQISHRGNYLMPYLDGIDHVDDMGDHFRITAGGDYCCGSTSGFLSSHDSDDNQSYCANCEDSCDATYDVYTSRHSSQSWCEYCRDNHTFYCYGNDNRYDSELVSSVEVDGRTYSEYYAENNFSFCQNTNEYARSTREVIVDVHSETQEWCDNAIADDAFTCRHDGKLYHNNLKSPHMTEDEEDAPVAVMNDERSTLFHSVPEQIVLSLKLTA